MKNNEAILVVEDDFITRKAISLTIGSKYDVVEASDYDSAMSQYSGNNVILTVLDINYNKDKDGIDVLRAIKKMDCTAPVIILSSSVQTDVVVECMKIGAYDYITKNVDKITSELLLRIDSALKRNMEQRSYESLKLSLNDKYSIISDSVKIKSILEEIDAVGNMNILIEGETGVGKTPVAKYANTVMSRNQGRPFVRINCAGLNRERLQDELFGHIKGAYTGAVSDRKGLVEAAKGGDLFLDEIGDMNLECQAELLTFLDNGEYRRLGETVTRHSDCRIISATNLNLKEQVEKRLFRKDLYSRLAQCKIGIPPLRDRKEDIQPIMEFYIKKFYGFSKDYEPGIIELYKKYDWQEGNVRELKDAVVYMCNKAKSCDSISLEHVGLDCSGLDEDNSDASVGTNCTNDSIQLNISKEDILKFGLKKYISYLEKQILMIAIRDEKSIRSLAKKMDMIDMTLLRKFKKYNIAVS